jgi:hypothetical protein
MDTICLDPHLRSEEAFKTCNINTYRGKHLSLKKETLNIERSMIKEMLLIKETIMAQPRTNKRGIQ